MPRTHLEDALVGLLRTVIRGGLLVLRIALHMVAVVIGGIRRGSVAAARRLLGVSPWVREATATTDELGRLIDELEAELAARDREIVRLESLLAAQDRPAVPVSRSA